MSVLGLLAVCASPVLAQERPEHGTYEDFSSLLVRPVGRLDESASAAWRSGPLSRWVEVESRDDVTTVRFMPDGRVSWRVRWGEHGPRQKLTLIDGELFTRSRFEYDDAGHLVRKVVTGPGAGPGITYDYTTDEHGRVLTRTATLPPTPNGLYSGAPGEVEVVRVEWGATHTTVRTERNGTLLRQDRFDVEGRVLGTTLYSRGSGGPASLRYRRGSDGELRSVRRVWPGRPAVSADPTHPDPAVGAWDVFLVLGTPIERHEALLFLGAPITTTDAGTGLAREIDDDWSNDCWMNDTSGAHYDATGRATSTSTACVCGFCVDAELDASAASEVLATDLHWTAGPWVRLDGEVDVTADHALMTPRVPVLAGELAGGDIVLDVDGRPRTLRSVEHLVETTTLRLGRNLRTTEGTFAAGGFLFASEMPRTCP